MSTNSGLKDELIEQSKKIFTHNTRRGYSSWKQTDYQFISPADKEYVYQWLWDTAFHAIVLSHFDTAWAKREIKSFLTAQREDGFLPHIIFWGNSKNLPHWAYLESNISFRPQTTAITQPPALALAVEKIYQHDKDNNFLGEVLYKLAKHHRWLLENRDPDNDHLISIISPNESGMDELPVFQAALGFTGQDAIRLHYYYKKSDFLNYFYRYNDRNILKKDYFTVEEVLFNCVFIESSRALARLFSKLGDTQEALFFEKTANLSEQALLTKCWDEEDTIFYSLFSQKDTPIRVKTIASLLPLFLDGLTGRKLDLLIKNHLLNPDEFWLPYPIPSVAKSEPYYYPKDTPLHKVKLLWRGPTWINTNWFIIKGLQKHGYNDIAQHLIKRMTEMIQQSGFREYYNPETGEGYRRTNFGWSTLLVDLLD